MSNTTLPEELVSEMYTAIGESRLVEDAAEKCASIAMQYCDIQLPKITNQLRLNQISITELSKQRDELLEALKYIASADIPPVKFKTKTAEAMHLQQVIDNLTNKAKKSIENYECTHSSDKWCISCYESKKDEIIELKKHEDGK